VKELGIETNYLSSLNPIANRVFLKSLIESCYCVRGLQLRSNKKVKIVFVLCNMNHRKAYFDDVQRGVCVGPKKPITEFVTRAIPWQPYQSMFLAQKLIHPFIHGEDLVQLEDVA